MKFRPINHLAVTILAICQVKLLLASALAPETDHGQQTAPTSDGILGDNLILDPLPGKTGEPAALIFLVGAYCQQEQYVSHLKSIQQKVPFPLWVGIPHIVGDLPIPVGIGLYVDSVKSELQNKHGFKADKYFFGGHSLGGSSIGSWAHSNIE